MAWLSTWVPIVFSYLAVNNTHSIVTLPYEPEIVQLTGLLCESVCPGPPEYASIEMGDAPEHVFVLKLDSPVHMRDFNSEESWNEPEDNVSEIQVAATTKDARHLVNKHVVVTGSLFHAITAHHRTDVVMISDYLDLIK
ncbi:MAG TPA: DUF4431 domain-containing protein [Rhabdochlamydiaceae bacterium]|jgi:hypothetical protein